VFLRPGPPHPVVGFAVHDALPALRSDAAGRGSPVTWPLAFRHLVAESARMGLRELDRLAAAAEQGGESLPAVTNSRNCPTRSTRCCAHLPAPDGGC
jgi:hypothetical protein